MSTTQFRTVWSTIGSGGPLDITSDGRVTGVRDLQNVKCSSIFGLYEEIETNPAIRLGRNDRLFLEDCVQGCDTGYFGFCDAVKIPPRFRGMPAEPPDEKKKKKKEPEPDFVAEVAGFAAPQYTAPEGSVKNDPAFPAAKMAKIGDPRFEPPGLSLTTSALIAGGLVGVALLLRN